MSRAGQQFYARAKARIPGGTQLLSKRPEMILPEQWPTYYKKVSGIEVWDLDGRRFLDMSYNGLGSCILGAADPDVDRAVCDAIQAGTMSTLNCPEEVELAELLCELHPWASKVRYARCGGEAMTMAVRIARAATRRDCIAFCGYHGWHDWYLAANLGEQDKLGEHLLPGLDPAGVPQGLAGTAFPFTYNRIEELKAIIDQRGSKLAAIVMEPIRSAAPEPGFLEEVRALASECGAVLVFDEITAGWRLNSGGAHLTLGTQPDVAIFAKAISNGYPMAAVIGIEEVMDAAQDSFISSTYWSERIGPVAALATIQKHLRCDVARHLSKIGRQVKEGWQAAASRSGLTVGIGGMDPLPHLSFVGDAPQATATLFTQEMLERGFLATRGFYVTYAHQEAEVDEYLSAVNDVFDLLQEAHERHEVLDRLQGPVAHAGFCRLA